MAKNFSKLMKDVNLLYILKSLKNRKNIKSHTERQTHRHTHRYTDTHTRSRRVKQLKIKR